MATLVPCKMRNGDCLHSFTAGIGINFTILPRFLVQNMRESCRDGDQAYGTTAVMGLGLREQLTNV